MPLPYILSKEIDLCHALIDALRRDYVEFVELLMDYGTPLEKLTLDNLEQLYASTDVWIVYMYILLHLSFICLLYRLTVVYQ